MDSVKKLESMLLKLNEKDDHIVRQLIAILFRYLEKRGRI